MSVSDSERAEFLIGATANLTHELRNVLAIVKETAGLVDDIMASGQSNSLNHDKLRTLVGRIESQTDRGAELASVLQQLTHACEDPDLPMDLSQIAMHVTVMCNRSAKKKRQSIRVRSPDGEVHVAGDQLIVYMAIHTAVTCCLELLPESAVLDLHIGPPLDRVPMDMLGSVEGVAVPIDPTQELTGNKLNKIVAGVGASLEVEKDKHRLRIVFPVTSIG
jgi:hypothetical protein